MDKRNNAKKGKNAVRFGKVRRVVIKPGLKRLRRKKRSRGKF